MTLLRSHSVTPYYDNREACCTAVTPLALRFLMSEQKKILTVIMTFVVSKGDSKPE